MDLQKLFAPPYWDTNFGAVSNEAIEKILTIAEKFPMMEALTGHGWPMLRSLLSRMNHKRTYWSTKRIIHLVLRGMKGIGFSWITNHRQIRVSTLSNTNHKPT